MRMADAVRKAVRKGFTIAQYDGYGHGKTVNLLGALYVGRFGGDEIEKDPLMITQRLRDEWPVLETQGRNVVGLGRALRSYSHTYTVSGWEKQSLLRTLATLSSDGLVPPAVIEFLDVVRL